MNQEQRKFLIDQVNKESKNQIDKLKEKIPDRPSLNNYLVAAFLDNTIEFNDISTLRVKMRNTVLKYGHSDKLVESEKNEWSNYRHENPYVKILPEDLFVIPNSYQQALIEYKEKKEQIDAQIKHIESMTLTIITKIQIGSNAAMDKLVMQIDNLGDLNLVNTQLMLNTTNSNKIEEAEKNE